ncbi:hypothetical protein IJ765_01435 [Candidatus Saccharibacteria bacterium]|nr:hypothetical protein [Candidatus Saccharibacteria bacterium]
MKNAKSIIWGIALIALGVILGGNALGLFSIDIFFDGWWTLFIIVPCFINLFTEGKQEWSGNIIGIIIGVCLLLACQNLLDFDMVWKLIVPIIIIGIGVSLLFKNVIKKEVSEKIKELNKELEKEGETAAVFSGQKIKIDKEFNGKSLNAIFGGIELNLMEAKIKKDVVIDACAVFGGIDILLPDDVNVEIKSTSIFGGVSDKRKIKTEKKDGKPTIYIDANCAFGGVSVK